MQDEIIYLFSNFNGIAVEFWEWISNFIPYFTGHVITYPLRDTNDFSSMRSSDNHLRVISQMLP